MVAAKELSGLGGGLRSPSSLFLLLSLITAFSQNMSMKEVNLTDRLCEQRAHLIFNF